MGKDIIVGEISVLVGLVIVVMEELVEALGTLSVILAGESWDKLSVQPDNLMHS